MNISQALQVPLPHVLQKLGHLPVKEKHNQLWYRSPFREEKTPSFHVHSVKNIWYDFGEEIGGNVIAFAITHLKKSGNDHSAADALRWIKNITGIYDPIQVNYQRHEPQKIEPKLVLRQQTKLAHLALIRYLESRGIPVILANKHVREVLVKNVETNSSFFAIGFKNEDDGWELRNPLFKGCIAPKTISFVRGSKINSEQIHIFEGFMDFLSVAAQTQLGLLEGDAIILNSLSCLTQSFPYIKDYGYKTLYSWLDNDIAGSKATEKLKEFIATEQGLMHRPMNEKYAPHKDVNAWHMHELGLVL
jgi:DNA primase